MKRKPIFVMLIAFVMLFSACGDGGDSGVSVEDYEKVKAQLANANGQIVEAQNQIKDLESELEDANGKISEYKKQIDELSNGPEQKLVEIRNAFDSGKWEEVINLASEYHQKYNGSEGDIEAQELAAQSQAKIDEEAARQAEEEAKGYETGITYDQLARTPDDYFLSKVKFYGKVVQVLEGDDSVTIRLAVDGSYDQILMGEYDKDIVSSRVLEDDYITIYGYSLGTISYESTMGQKITIPGISIDKIDQ